MKDITIKVLKKENEGKLKSDFDFQFMNTYLDPILSFYQVVEAFINNSDIEAEEDKETVVYLTMCSLAISFGKDKAIYRKLFSELRMRNVYGLLEPLTEFTEFLINYFNQSLKSNISYDIFSMFSHPLFIPFLESLATIINKEKIDLDNFDKITALAEDHIKEFDKITVKDYTNSLSPKDVEHEEGGKEILKWDVWKKQNGFSDSVERIDEDDD